MPRGAQLNKAMKQVMGDDRIQETKSRYLDICLYGDSAGESGMSDGELKRPLSSPSGLLEDDLSSLSGLGALPDSACQEFLSVIFSWRSLSSL